MPRGEVAPGWVLPTCGFGHHQVAARPSARGRSVAAVPMNGSTSSKIPKFYPAYDLRSVTGTFPVRIFRLLRVRVLAILAGHRDLAVRSAEEGSP
ncbi:hypothetical protein JCM9533A_19320 [Catenuloplanes niger JCM 9533]